MARSAAARIAKPSEEAEVELDLAGALRVASANLDRARGNLAEAKRRHTEALTAIETAAEEVRGAGVAMVDDPAADALFNDATAALVRASARADALLKHTIPTAEKAVQGRTAEYEAARAAYTRERFVDTIRRELLPADRAFVAAIEHAGAAYDACLKVRAAIKRDEAFRPYWHNPATNQDRLETARLAGMASPELIRFLAGSGFADRGVHFERLAQHLSLTDADLTPVSEGA